jgi:signal recognition particle GTPase
MSQFAELFKAVKNEPKNSLGNNENKKPASVENLKRVKTKDEKNRKDKPGNVPNSDAQNLKKQTQAAEKPEAASGTAEKPLRLQEEPKIAGNPKKTGKSSNADYTQVLTYIRRNTHRQIKKILIDDPDERDVSDLVEELLSDWLKKNV